MKQLIPLNQHRIQLCIHLLLEFALKEPLVNENKSLKKYLQQFPVLNRWLMLRCLMSWVYFQFTIKQLSKNLMQFATFNKINELYEQEQFNQDLKLYTEQFYSSKQQQEIQQKAEPTNNQLNQQKQQNIQCMICLESSPKNEMKILNCNHIFHLECLNRYYLALMQGKEWPFPCPICKNPIDQQDVEGVLIDKKMQEVSDLAFQKYVEQNREEYSCCPTPGCEYVFIQNGYIYFKCPLCHKQYCLDCKVEFHVKQTCQEYKAAIKVQKENESDDKFYAFVKGAKFKQCPSCKMWVEKNEGCNHMTCRCKNQFGYICGKGHKKGGPCR